MDFGICIWMDIAIRALPEHTSEMLTQLLFGETYSVLESTPEWVKISTTDCQYEGWMSRKQHTALSEDTFIQYQTTKLYLVRDLLLYVHDVATHIVFPIVIGSQFPEPVQGRFDLGHHSFKVELPEPQELLRHEGLSDQQDNMLAFALHYLNAPYLWGGRTPAGLDCSAFVQLTCKSIGLNMPRDAAQQINIGKSIDFVDESRIGDLAFFENEEGQITHTGIVCGYHQILHASGYVQINTLDETGIYNQTLKKYTHKLSLIKRVLS